MPVDVYFGSIDELKVYTIVRPFCEDEGDIRTLLYAVLRGLLGTGIS